MARETTIQTMTPGRNGSRSVEEDLFKKIIGSTKKMKKVKKRGRKVTFREKALTAVISAAILLFAVGAAYYYNLFIELKYNIRANVAQIEAQLQKRKNLTVNLGETVVEYSRHEKGIFTHLAELRAGGEAEGSVLPPEIQEALKQNAGLMEAGAGIDPKEWEGMLSNLVAVAEQYPALRLSENFRSLMDAILQFEGEIAGLRMTYNTSVNTYTTTRDQFPGYVYAKLFRCEDYEYFRMDEDAAQFIPIKYGLAEASGLPAAVAQDQ